MKEKFVSNDRLEELRQKAVYPKEILKTIFVIATAAVVLVGVPFCFFSKNTALNIIGLVAVAVSVAAWAFYIGFRGKLLKKRIDESKSAVYAEAVVIRCYQPDESVRWSVKRYCVVDMVVEDGMVLTTSRTEKPYAEGLVVVVKYVPKKPQQCLIIDTVKEETAEPEQKTKKTK